MKDIKSTTKTVFKIRLKKDDVVVVRAGKYKGQSGKVLATHPTLNKVTVEGINIVKKHMKPNKQYPQGGIIPLTKPIDVSKVGILDPATKKASRIGYKIDAKGAKTRVFKTSGKEIK
ncbi:MAG: 50S ribosomal protein L24 [Candidatus Saccharibacteria bacterium]|jgi:large subunit ribosomal protein L24|nr:50S ribosomal protein L24 [Candidatus Saccharibacteria bacterium]